MPAKNLQQNVQWKIRTGLQSAQAELAAPLLFGHLCKGNLEKPGVLRVSAVVGKAGNEVLTGIANPCDHDTAFLRHVQRFGREKTLLNWLVCWTREKMRDPIRNKPDVSFTASFLLHKGNGLVRYKSAATSVSVTFKTELLGLLAPRQLAFEYLKVLYLPDKKNEQANESSSYCGRRLDELKLLAAQLRTLDAIKHCNYGSKNAFQKLCKAYVPAGTPDDFLMLRLLSALQTVFLYARVFDKNCLKAGGFVSVSRLHADSFEDIKNIENIKVRSKLLETVPIFAVSASVANKVTATNYKKILAEVATRIPIAEAVMMLTMPGNIAAGIGQKVCLKTGFASASATQLSHSIVKHVPNPPFKDWCNNAAVWMAHLVSLLRGAKHEGGSLEFIFVLGDMAQIKDSPAFEYLSLADAGFEFPPDGEVTNEDDMLKSLDQAKRTIEKENYFWFQGGRYALLWDFTFPEPKPRYLLGLKDSSWHVFIANARNRRPPDTAKAALVVGYLDGYGGGGLIVHGEHEFSLSKDGKWIQRGDELFDRIDAYLKAAGAMILASNERKTLVKALVAVSNDPDTGCMLVLAKGKTIPKFETMGQPWEVKRLKSRTNGNKKGESFLELPDQELVALLGMDGAACVWKRCGKCRIAFRRLASPDDANKSHKPAEKARTNMLGEGTRKWSALLAACRKDVNLIIAVSQDGPVHFYCRAEFAKGVHKDQDAAGFSANFGTWVDDVVIYDKFDGKEL